RGLRSSAFGLRGPRPRVTFQLLGVAATNAADLGGRELGHAALVRPQFHRAFQWVQFDDAAARAATVVARLGALARHALEQIAVHLVLVLQAAHEAPAWPADLLWVEGQLLISRHADAHGVEALQPGAGARAVAAHAQRAEHARLIARPD